jgi:hypothetical protein
MCNFNYTCAPAANCNITFTVTTTITIIIITITITYIAHKDSRTHTCSDMTRIHVSFITTVTSL